MPNLILRPSGLENPNKAWALQLRYHDSVGETEYHTLTYVSRETADEIIKAGEASYLFGDPEKYKEYQLPLDWSKVLPDLMIVEAPQGQDVRLRPGADGAQLKPVLFVVEKPTVDQVVEEIKVAVGKLQKHAAEAEVGEGAMILTHIGPLPFRGGFLLLASLTLFPGVASEDVLVEYTTDQWYLKDKTIDAPSELSPDRPHVWVTSTLGHGGLMCANCKGTERELAVIGDLDRCPSYPSAPIRIDGKLQ